MKKSSTKRILINCSVLIVCLFVILFVIFISPPTNFNAPVLVEIEEGDTLSRIGQKMMDAGVVRSTFWFHLFVILRDGEHRIPVGQYNFNEPKPVYLVADKIVAGNYGLRPVRVTIIEGWNLFVIADYLDERFDNFDRHFFFSSAKEGYLAPDTYFFSPLISTKEILRRMEMNFNLKVNEILEEYELRRPLEDIIIMASILEAEANTRESKRKVADVLWKRLDDGMPLQVDATFSYVNNKNTYQLTLDDLQIDNPYNTYKYTGLPPTPINNPGTIAIKAAIDPIENPYWYFLSDLSGNMYYARDFDGHQFNRENYLRR